MNTKNWRQLWSTITTSGLEMKQTLFLQPWNPQCSTFLLI